MFFFFLIFSSFCTNLVTAAPLSVCVITWLSPLLLCFLLRKESAERGDQEIKEMQGDYPKKTPKQEICSALSSDLFVRLSSAVEPWYDPASPHSNSATHDTSLIGRRFDVPGWSFSENPPQKIIWTSKCFCILRLRANYCPFPAVLSALTDNPRIILVSAEEQRFEHHVSSAATGRGWARKEQRIKYGACSVWCYSVFRGTTQRWAICP